MQGISISLVLLVLLATVFVSGCVSLNTGTGVSFGSGLEILDFEPEMSSVYSDEMVKFRLKVKNSGSFEVDSAIAYIDLTEWNCFPEGAQFGPLIAPSEDRGTEGEEKVINFECKSPVIEEGLSVPFEARAEIEYNYRTVSSKSVSLLPTKELLAYQNSGKALPSEIISESKSPLDIDIQIEGPIRFRSNDNEIEFPVTIKIVNSGGGIVLNSITGQPTVNLDIEGTGGLTELDCDQYDMHLWRGQSQTITCKMLASNSNVMTQSRIVATLEYDYLISRSANIEVVGITR